jgi:hypothetical protein
MTDDVAVANDDDLSAMDAYIRDLKEEAEFNPTAALMLQVFEDMEKFGAVRGCGPDYNGAVYFATVRAMTLCGIPASPEADKCARILSDVIGEVWDASNGGSVRFHILPMHTTTNPDEGLRWPTGETFAPLKGPHEKPW